MISVIKVIMTLREKKINKQFVTANIKFVLLIFYIITMLYK